MTPIAAVRAWFRRLRGARHGPRLVRRVGIDCPHGRGRVEIDLLTDRVGKPEAVLRCSAHRVCPPACDQACRLCAEAILAPAHALIIYPPDGPLDDY